MLAVDTNVVIRYLIGDDPAQAAQARALIDTEDVFVCTTVLLETALVLRTTYGYPQASLAKVLRAFAGLPRVTIENEHLTARALDWMEGGMDFADALHLTRADGCKALVSFDRRFVRAANRLGGVKVRAP